MWNQTAYKNVYIINYSPQEYFMRFIFVVLHHYKNILAKTIF